MCSYLRRRARSGGQSHRQSLAHLSNPSPSLLLRPPALLSTPMPTTKTHHLMSLSNPPPTLNPIQARWTSMTMHTTLRLARHRSTTKLTRTYGPHDAASALCTSTTGNGMLSTSASGASGSRRRDIRKICWSCMDNRLRLYGGSDLVRGQSAVPLLFLISGSIILHGLVIVTVNSANDIIRV